MTYQQTIDGIRPPDRDSMERAKRRWDSIAKPLGSLGLLEDAVIRLAGMQCTEKVQIEKPAVAVFCADNGVVAEGVTQTDSAVTAVVAGNMTCGKTSVCVMAARAGAGVVPVDVGMNTDVQGVRRKKTRYGTDNFVHGPAMSREDALHAIEAGIEIACELHAQGCTLLATGEMGIGNTTTSSAVASVLLSLQPEEVTGRGAGLTGDGLNRKIRAIRAGIDINKPDVSDPLDVLAKVGGLDLAGLCGAFLGGAFCGMGMLVDGFISSVAALLAVRVCPDCAGYLLASHVSKEPAAKCVMEELGLNPFLQANLCLGEGTGAVAVIPILQMANDVYRGMSTFEDIDIDAYEDLSGKEDLTC